jgi:hypothetical protein
MIEDPDAVAKARIEALTTALLTVPPVATVLQLAVVPAVVVTQVSGPSPS